IVNKIQSTVVLFYNLIKSSQTIPGKSIHCTHLSYSIDNIEKRTSEQKFGFNCSFINRKRGDLNAYGGELAPSQLLVANDNPERSQLNASTSIQKHINVRHSAYSQGGNDHDYN
ncbi:hypothetical protein, partial [Secundilactobacillus paracollinoides]